MLCYVQVCAQLFCRSSVSRNDVMFIVAGRVCLRSLKVRADKGAAPTNDASDLSRVIAAQNLEDERG